MLKNSAWFLSSKYFKFSWQENMPEPKNENLFRSFYGTNTFIEKADIDKTKYPFKSKSGNGNGYPDFFNDNSIDNWIIIVECKAKNVNIKENCVEQIGIYNKFLNSKYLIITNGIKIYCWEKDNDKYKVIKLDDVKYI